MKDMGRLMLLLTMFWGLGTVPLRAQTGEEPQALFQKALGSVLQNDFNGLMSICDPSMKAVVTPDMVADLNRRLLMRFKAGYVPTYMGFLNKQGAQVYYWKLALKDRGDDVLMTLVVRNGQVSALNLSGYTGKN